MQWNGPQPTTEEIEAWINARRSQGATLQLEDTDNGTFWTAHDDDGVLFDWFPASPHPRLIMPVVENSEALQGATMVSFSVALLEDGTWCARLPVSLGIHKVGFGHDPMDAIANLAAVLSRSHADVMRRLQ